MLTGEARRVEFASGDARAVLALAAKIQALLPPVPQQGTMTPETP